MADQTLMQRLMKAFGLGAGTPSAPPAAGVPAEEAVTASAVEAGNPELETLRTHAAGATDLQETRVTDTPVAIQPPVNSGAVDMREDRFHGE
ncbi:hypothetical protein N6H14_10615 [Paenibacillus sp. CC-CFT747]|nr:hypothetical protein N6H14_10615 [Paenibacillus sp. CC-CFT747]